MKFKNVILLFAVFICLEAYPQQIHTFSGYVYDEQSGENLIGVTLYFPGLKKGTVSNNYGYFSISLPQGSHLVQFRYMGYQQLEKELQVDNDLRLDFMLKEENLKLDEVTVKASSGTKKIQNTQLGTEIIPMKTIKLLPSIAGETDIFKVIQLMPGIQSQSDGSSGFNVRGGNYDQNLVILDEAVVYNPGHVFGIFSVFNDDAINSVTINKGDLSANYGGRLSSVVDIVAKEGNNQKFAAKGSLGLLSSKLTLEGPIVKDKSSFIISGRRTYIDLLAKPMMDGNQFYFDDLNAKINYKIGNKDRVFLSLYQGKDKFLMAVEDDRFSWESSWGNTTTTLRWNHLFNDKLFFNTSLIYNNFFRNFTETQEGNVENKESEVNDKSIKLDLTYFMKSDHKVKLGAQGTLHQFTDDDNLQLNPNQYATELSAYLMDEFSITDIFMFNIGVRYSQFQNIGPYDEYIFDEKGEPVTVINSYERHVSYNTYQNIEPRLAARFLLSEQSSFKVSYTQNTQYVNLISTSGSILPTETWIPSNKVINPQKSEQYALGFFHDFKDGTYQASAELYYKNLDNQIEYSDSQIRSFTNSTRSEFVFGEGTARGIELFIKKTQGRLQGWVAYTLADNKRKFDDLNKGKEFFAPNDVRHNFTLTGSYNLNEKWSLGLNFIFRTGQPFTIPESRFFANGEVVDQYGARNNYRLPSYNRMDISATYKPLRENRRLKSEWVFAIYNVYNRFNPSYIYFEDEGSVLDNNLITKAKAIAIVPFLPSVTWRFNF